MATPNPTKTSKLAILRQLKDDVSKYLPECRYSVTSKPAFNTPYSTGSDAYLEIAYNNVIFYVIEVSGSYIYETLGGGELVNISNPQADWGREAAFGLLRISRDYVASIEAWDQPSHEIVETVGLFITYLEKKLDRVYKVLD